MIDALQRCVVEAQLADEKNILQREAEMFLRAGGGVTLTEWGLLSEASKVALLEAEKVIDRERFGESRSPEAAERDIVSKMADAAERKATS